MGVGIRSHPMRPGTSMKEIRWRSTGLMTKTSYIRRCSGQALQILIRRAWSPRGVGKQQGLGGGENGGAIEAAAAGDLDRRSGGGRSGQATTAQLHVF